jgi:hypothetical protein
MNAPRLRVLEKVPAAEMSASKIRKQSRTIRKGNASAAIRLG